MADRIEIEVDGKTYRGEGRLTLGRPRPTRRSVPGGGFIEGPPGPSYIAGTVVFDEPMRGSVLRAIDGATVRVTKRDGQTAEMTNAWVQEAPDGRLPNEYHVQIMAAV